ncbi:uncharacterized protein EV420DRAFT_876668 [Desarmillaria tabescens]|uniref:DUF6533 domain-containing protein n=1 Tax=Armillaria tabescens TaxID=1929756 RepID=A0AA39JVS1_ARMTA|nr:uncharacterized protein EV420DRAFT_876668 [Desarmillaria tabescens]KAK0447463.1 hypothetical protein EV420DRAFT_876668 [Desarmillaria tabescens]
MLLTTFSLFFTSYSQTACATVLIYDILLLLPTEIKYVWLPRPLHPRLLLFALNRYSPLVDTALSINWLLQTATPALCRRFLTTVSPFVLIGIFTSQVILMIRTYAMWDRRRTIFWCFVGIGVFSFIPGTLCIVISLKTTQFVTLSGEPGCLNLSSTNIMAVAYILMLVADTIIALLTLLKGVEHLRRSSHPFLTELYASGMLFYVCIFFISLANILVPVWVPGLTASLGCFQRIFHSVLCNRVMLLIFKQRRRYPTGGSYTDGIELSDTTRST